MSDASFLAWPFFDAHHRQHAAALERWAAESLDAIDHHDTDTACRALVAALGRDGKARRLRPIDRMGP